MEKGLVYESKKPVFWSTGAQTALAEAEVEYADREDPAIYVKFPIATGAAEGQGEHRHLDDDAVDAAGESRDRGSSERALRRCASSLKDGRVRDVFVLAESLVEKFCAATGWDPVGEPTQTFPGAKLEGIGAQHPFLPRTSIVITADFVTMDTGTGAVHIAPGHGEDDYSLGSKNGLPDSLAGR